MSGDIFGFLEMLLVETRDAAECLQGMAAEQGGVIDCKGVRELNEMLPVKCMVIIPP